MTNVLVTGYAKAPQGTAMAETYKYIGIVLEIDPHSDVIQDAEFTFIADLTKSFFRKLVVGYDMSQGVEHLIKHISQSYFAPSLNSINVAMKAAFRRYYENKNKLSSE
ncbi:hypothetical protein CHL76_14690 [Marinococcus halophilus]|uniref:DUF3870 domain-containing protein n=1 Tax=Marinococcus halophilus TaxID=1371 RepID=A0A510Y9A1_MARHA|nr:DUF3870 domain-containing protein [Marinococcus halophilus]OZT79064.1 hypothetical protein CHL76_14690 [Marinococcus halophilus]GEK59952.1 hypothetical protein MHA01_28570 [Marinococcus halophilus]